MSKTDTYTGLNKSFLMDWKRVNIEASTRCNLLCPGCSRTQEMALGNSLAGGIDDMDIEVFKLLVRPENKLDVITYNMALSDPIYSGTLFEQLRYLKTLDKRPIINMSTNGSGRSEKWWKELANLLLPTDIIEFAIDGLEDTNHIYRVNAKWHTIIRAVNTLRSNFSGKIIWRYIVFEHNYHQIAEANKLSIGLGFDLFKTMIGDTDRTPLHMQLKSKTWEEVFNDLPKV
jgi:sulfatase maturation enzyme AslB (radical SAM superfamily)